MRHKKTKQMLDYWMDLFRGKNPHFPKTGQPIWPDRADIQPADCRSLLGDMFILERTEDGMRYRLAGTRLCALYGRELRGERFEQAYVPADHRAIVNWTDGLNTEGVATLICSSAENADGRRVVLETLLLPLNCGGVADNRIVGSTVVCEPPIWIGDVPLVRQRMRSQRSLAPWVREFVPQTEQPTRIFEAPPMQHDPLHTLDAPIHSENKTTRNVQHLKVIEGGRQ